MNDILIVSDMADLREMQKDPQFKYMDFMFACRPATKLMGWVPDTIYITRRGELTMGDEVETALKLRRAQGTKVCPAN